MILMFAGSGALTPYVIKHGGSRLHSFLNERPQIASWSYPNALMVDSGAHSWNKLGMHSVGGAARALLPNIHAHMKSYMDFMEAHKEKPFVFVELDCYGHLSKDYLDGIYREVMQMPGRSFEFIRVYHPAIDGGSLRTLQGWIDEGQSYIGVGNDSQSYYGDIFRLTLNTVKLHCFACTKMDVLNKYPFYSVDSTTALAPGRYGGALEKGRYLAKDRLIKRKSVTLVSSLDRKTDSAVRQMVEAQEYFTKLWAKRGITWD
jgi:hypothetical protein